MQDFMELMKEILQHCLNYMQANNKCGYGTI